MAQMGVEDPPRALLSGKRGGGGGCQWAEEKERRGMGSGESISSHIVITRHFACLFVCEAATPLNFPRRMHTSGAQ